MTEQETLARRIFNWLRQGDDPSSPQTFNPDADKLEIGVEGYLDCRALAAAIVSGNLRTFDLTGQ